MYVCMCLHVIGKSPKLSVESQLSPRGPLTENHKSNNDISMIYRSYDKPELLRVRPSGRTNLYVSRLTMYRNVSRISYLIIPLLVL